MTVYQIIKQYLFGQSATSEDGFQHEYIDFVCIGNTGLGFNPHAKEQDYLGSTAGLILRAKRMNVLFIPSWVHSMIFTEWDINRQYIQIHNFQ